MPRSFYRLFVVLAWALMCAAASQSLAKDAQPSPQSTLLAEIANSVERTAKEGKLPLVVFDIDDTLFDTRLRHQIIMQDFAESLRAENPVSAMKFDSLGLPSIAWSFEANLDKIGIDDKMLRAKFADYWKLRFFSDLCAQDPMIPGGLTYVRMLHKKGALIVYLTGRDVGRMYNGTVQALSEKGFPMGIERSQLILKGTKDIGDTEFKASTVSYIKKLGTLIAGFDNEPGNVNVFRKNWPGAFAVFVETRHSPVPEPLLDGIVRIRDFTNEP